MGSGVIRFEPDRLLALPPRETVATHDARDVMLYALAVGAAIDDPTGNLRFTYERDLRVLPTMAVVMAWPGFWLAEPRYGVDWKRVLHGAQSLDVHGPLPVSATLLGRLIIEDIYDKGQKGAVLCTRRDLYDVTSGDHLATERRTTFLGGDGGKGGRTDPIPPPHAVPNRRADEVAIAPTRVDQALLYRLCGDRNPFHADPAVAAEGGFKAPILHGLCTYGVVGRTLLHVLCEDDVTRFRHIECRFATPVYPGETLVTEIWHEGSGGAAFRTKSKDRDVVVLNNGYVEVDSE
jgi:acyl dehydratase